MRHDGYLDFNSELNPLKGGFVVLWFHFDWPYIAIPFYVCLMCVDALTGVEDASGKKILMDMLFWALDNPPPATFMLISGDIDFSSALHQLRMRRYNILLAQPQNGSVLLVHAARTVWLWTSQSAGGSPLTQSGSSQLVANETTSRRPVPSPVRQNPNSPSAALFFCMLFLILIKVSFSKKKILF